MFWERFYNLCLEHGTKPNPVAEQVGISSGLITKWKHGATPNTEALVKIADFFDVSVDYLLGKSTEPDKTGNTELEEYLEELRTRPEMKMLFNLTKNATKEDVEKAVKIIETMLGK